MLDQRHGLSEDILHSELQDPGANVGNQLAESIICQRRGWRIRVSDGRRGIKVHSILKIKCFPTNLNPVPFGK